MKRTKRLLSIFLTLCLLLGMLPTTARAASALSITQQPTAENKYTVIAKDGYTDLTSGFQWYKRVDTATTYTLVDKNPKADELAVDAVYFGSYTNGHWEDGTGIFVFFLSSPGDEITVTVSGGEAPEDTNNIVTFESGSSGVYTATSTGGMLGIRIESSEDTVTATITVKRCWTPVAGQTSASLRASESGTYYCAVSLDDEGAITNTVDVVVPHSHPICGASCSHTGPHDNKTWTALTPEMLNSSNSLSSGSYYLTKDIAVTKDIYIMNATVNLCLNGHKLTFRCGSHSYGLHIGRSGQPYNGTLNLCDCQGGGLVELTGGNDYACIWVYGAGKGVFNLYSGGVKSAGYGIRCFGSGSSYNGPITVYGGSVIGGTQSAIAITEGYSANILGGTITGGTYGIQYSYKANITLSGTPTISGKTAALRLVTLPAVNTALENATVDATNYNGGKLEVEEYRPGDSVGKYAIKGGEGKFTLTNTCYKYEYESGGMVIREDHNWATGWTSDANGHWHSCRSGCPITDNTQKDGYAAHSGGTATCTAKAVCAVCKQEYGDLAAHDFSGDYRSDADGHWHKCKNCDATDTKANHDYDNDADTTCDTCGYKRTITPGEIKGEVDDTGAPGVDVNVNEDSLKDLAGTPQAGETITVKLTVVKKDDTADGAGEIKQEAAGKTVEFLDLSLVKTVTPSSGSSTDTPITNTNGKVLEIVVTYDFSGKTAVTVYRKHGGDAAAALDTLTSRPAPDAMQDNSFFANRTNGKLYIYATKFSTYAIAYTPDSGGNQPQPPSGGGGTGGWGGGYVPPTYPVALPASTPGGKLTASPKSASSGATVTLTPTPDEGYALGGVTVTDRNGKPVAVTAEKDGRYTFTMPSGGVTIKAEFVKRQGGYAACPGDSSCPLWPYTDASPTAWYHDALHFCLENGLMQGYGQSLLGPGRSVSRVEFVQMLYNREGRPAAGGFLAFEDVPDGAWYGDAVRWASVRGITGGYGNGQFGPSRSITRQELAVMLYRYAGSPAATDKELHFADADKVSDYAREALGWAVENGIVQGKNGGILDPGGNATRAEAAAMLQRFCGKEK